jgi:hypothetical protein
LQPTDSIHIPRAGDEPEDGDVLATGEAVLERAKAVSRQIRERVLQLAGVNASNDKARSE